MATWRNHSYEDAPEYDGERYTVAGMPGVAWWVLGWELGDHEVEDEEECWDCSGTGDGPDDDEDYPTTCEFCDGTGTVYNYRWEPYRTGMLLCVMVGDDAPHVVDPGDLTQLGELDYCAECGQVGCCHDGRERVA